jgi:hypothetical protein
MHMRLLSPRLLGALISSNSVLMYLNVVLHLASAYRSCSAIVLLHRHHSHLSLSHIRLKHYQHLPTDELLEQERNHGHLNPQLAAGAT